MYVKRELTLSHLVRVQHPADHARDDDEEDGKGLDPPGQDRGALGVRDRLGRKGLLNHHLERRDLTNVSREQKRTNGKNRVNCILLEEEMQLTAYISRLAKSHTGKPIKETKPNLN